VTRERQPSTAIPNPRQMALWTHHPVAEDPDYLSKQLITYIGNKRALLGQIGAALERVKSRLGKARLRILDAFSGSGVVSRLFKAHSAFLVSNDSEDYAAVIARCFLRNRSTVDMHTLCEIVRDLNDRVDTESLQPGFIEDLYAPRDEANITVDDRVFYTRDNARRLDNYRRLLEAVPDDYREMLLGPLLAKASVHANTSGVFKGFYKDRRTRIGRFGGTNGDALARIKGEIVLEPPVLSCFECEHEVLQDDANKLVQNVKDLDLAYFDPPYNQHPYGSNYFMLNLLVNYKRPACISKVSGIPVDWKRSGYYVRSRSLDLLSDLVNAVDSTFLLVSFNNEGFVRPDEMHSLLRRVGSVEVIEVPYNTFRGCRNLRNRNVHVTEQLFLVERHRLPQRSARLRHHASGMFP